MKHEVDERILLRHPPVSKESMRQKLSLYTICELLREVYWLTDSNDIKLRCRIATTMAKKMGAKLKEYKYQIDGDLLFDGSFLFEPNIQDEELWPYEEENEKL
jgi:hypothetical protein